MTLKLQNRDLVCIVKIFFPRGRIILLMISHIFFEILDLLYHQCDRAIKILVSLSHYCAYSFLETNLDFFCFAFACGGTV